MDRGEGLLEHRSIDGELKGLSINPRTTGEASSKKITRNSKMLLSFRSLPFETKEQILELALRHDWREEGLKASEYNSSTLWPSPMPRDPVLIQALRASGDPGCISKRWNFFVGSLLSGVSR